jgi:hypothetical protein
MNVLIAGSGPATGEAIVAALDEVPGYSGDREAGASRHGDRLVMKTPACYQEILSPIILNFVIFA